MILDQAVMLALAAAVGCGVGGGGLLVAYLTLFREVSQKAAQAENLLFFLFSAGASASVQLLRKSFPRWRPVLLTAASAIPGVALGSAVRNAIPEQALRTVFGAFLLLAGSAVFLRGRRSGDKEAEGTAHGRKRKSWHIFGRNS